MISRHRQTDDDLTLLARLSPPNPVMMLSFVFAAILSGAASAFQQVAPWHHAHHVHAYDYYAQPPPLVSPLQSSDSSTDDVVAELDDDRRANLFQSMLRDLQIENVPLLGCDAREVHTMNAALWRKFRWTLSRLLRPIIRTC